MEQKTKIMASGPITSWKIDGEAMETVADFIFLGSKIFADGDFSHEIKRCLLFGRKAMTNLDSILKSRDITLPTKVRLVKAMVFLVVDVWMWELDYKESWVPKNWCFWTVVLEKTLESPLDCKEIQPVNPKGNQSWIFFGRTGAEAEASILWPPEPKNWLSGKDPDAGKDWRQEKGTTAETPVLWPPHAKSWLIGKDSDAGRDWGQEEKGTTEDEMAGWHHRLDGHEFEWTPGVGDGQGGLVSCDSWGCEESDTTEWLNWTDKGKEYEGEFISV